MHFVPQTTLPPVPAGFVRRNGVEQGDLRNKAQEVTYREGCGWSGRGA